MTFPEVRRLRRDENPHAVGREHHGRAPSARTISAIRPERVSASNRIMAWPIAISIDADADADGDGDGGTAGFSGCTATTGTCAPLLSGITTGAKNTLSSSIAVKTSRPSRARLRPF